MFNHVIQRDRVRNAYIFYNGHRRPSSHAFARATLADSVFKYTRRARVWDAIGFTLARIGL